MSYESYITELKTNYFQSQSYHRKALRKMVCAKSTHYYLLQIWDGRYAAFWMKGIEGELCIAVAKHYLDESGFPFAFISEHFDEVREYINREELNMMELCGLSLKGNVIKFIPKRNPSSKKLEKLCIENMKRDEESFWKELEKIGLKKDEMLKIWGKQT